MKDLFSSQKIIQGDCLEVMRGMEPNSIDCILTDSPYGISFMGKHWDKGIPSKDFWIEALRVCKPGAIMLAFGGTRTYHRLTCAIEDSGWEIRDCLMWLYGQGFPKSHNFGKKLGREWEGFGTALKPSFEPIIMAMKSIEGTFAQNAEKWGVAGINIDACRIEGSYKSIPPNLTSERSSGIMGKKIPHPGGECHEKGRWPSNLLLDDVSAQMLDEQSGVLKSGTLKGVLNTQSKNQVYAKREKANINPFKENSGGASRFFYCAKASSSERNKGCEGVELKEAFKFDGIPKINQWTGQLETTQKMQNHHPTVKPIKLLEYLLTLIMPPNPNAIVLDPFAGSGSTLVAAKNLGFNAIGIEIEAEYYEIAKRRID